MVSRDPSGGLGLVICLYMIILTIVDGWDSVITPPGGTRLCQNRYFCTFYIIKNAVYVLFEGSWYMITVYFYGLCIGTS